MMNVTSRFQKQNIIGNEGGVAIIAALLILMLLSIIALTSYRTTVTEKAIVRSEAIFQRDFYFAESAAMEGIQKTANERAAAELLPALIQTGTINDGLIVDADAADPTNDDLNLDTNDDGNVVGADDMEASALSPDTFRLVIAMGVTTGNSLSLRSSSRLYEYMSYGLTETQGARSIVKVGFKKRF